MDDKMKRDLILLEGPNRAGKSSVFKELLRSTDYQLYVLDRFTGSHIVYDKLWKRNATSEDVHYRTEEALNVFFNPLVVYLYADVPILEERDASIKQKTFDSWDLVEKRPSDLSDIMKYYEEYLDRTPLDNIRIDTGVHDIETVVSFIKYNLNNRRADADYY